MNFGAHDFNVAADKGRGHFDDLHTTAAAHTVTFTSCMILLYFVL